MRREQIIIRALKAEKKKLEKRLAKVVELYNYDPVGEYIKVRSELGKLQNKIRKEGREEWRDPEFRALLDRGVKLEKQTEKYNIEDQHKYCDEKIQIEMDIVEIDGELWFLERKVETLCEDEISDEELLRMIEGGE